jgi:hypothetical protein
MKAAKLCEALHLTFPPARLSYRLKVVLLHLWRVNVKTTGGFISISLADFYTDNIAP